MASPECITLDSGSDSDVEFICDIKGEHKPKCERKFKNTLKIPKGEVDVIPIVDLDKEEEERKVSGIFKRSGRKMVSDAVEIVSSISAVHEENTTMKIEQVFSLTMTDNNNGCTPQKRRRISTTVTPLRPSSNSTPINQRRQSNTSTLPQKTFAQNQSLKKPTLPSAMAPKRSSQPMQTGDPKKRVVIVPVPSFEQKNSLVPNASPSSKPSPSKPKPSSSKPKPSPSKSKFSSSQPKASSSRVPVEAVVISDSDDEKSEESEHDSESENSPNVKLSKELIKKLISVCLNSKLDDDLKKKIKEKLNRYMDAASPNVLKRNYFIRMVKEIIKDVEAILDCPEIYESHEVTLCDKIKAIIAELKKDSLIVNNKLIRLTNIYNKLKRRIQRLEETEVDTDDESVNPYLLLDKYQKRATVVYNKMCEIQNIGNHADRPYLLPFSFKGKGPEPIERALEVYYNKTRKFPNFKEVVKLTKKVSEEKKLGLSEPEIFCTAQSVFTDFGRRLQMRRQRDDYHNLVSYINDGERDPAAEDPELLRKLEMNKHLYITKEQEVLDTFAKKQAMKEGKKKTEDSEDESNRSNESSDGESENEGENSDRSSLSSEENSPKKPRREESSKVEENSSGKGEVSKGEPNLKLGAQTPEIRSSLSSEEKSPKQQRSEESLQVEENSSGKAEVSKGEPNLKSGAQMPEIRSSLSSEEKSPKKPRSEESPQVEENSSGKGEVSKGEPDLKSGAQLPKIRSSLSSEEKSPKKPKSEESSQVEENSSEKGEVSKGEPDLKSGAQMPEIRSCLSSKEKSPKKPRSEESSQVEEKSPEKVKASEDKPDEKIILKEKTSKSQSRSSSEEKSLKKLSTEKSPKNDIEEISSEKVEVSEGKPK